MGQRPGEAGFTWSELVLVAIFVLGLFLAGLWAVVGIQDDTRESECQTALRDLKIATEAYRAATESYPASVDVLVDSRYLDETVEGYRLELVPGDLRPTYHPVGRCA